MKLFYSKGACSLAPHIALTEAGIPFELERVDLMKKRYGGGDYLKVNPKGVVPALQLDDGQVLTEVAVVLQYIAELKPETGLIPKAGTMERYRCQEWLNYIATEVHKGFGPLWKPDTVAETIATTRRNLEDRFAFLNERIGSAYLMGETYSVADAYLYTILTWMAYKDFDLGRWSSLKAYFGRVDARPATRAAVEAE